MSSLVPGSLFISTGLNRNHTPTPAFITNDELQERYSRAAFNGRPWPPSSPVAGVYDIRNSSTQLILLNNRKKKESQLRGRSNPRKEEHRYPSPERHSRCSTPVNREYHTQCLDSSSPYYEPETDLDMDWSTRSERPPNRFAAGSAVNPKRHTSCQVPTNPRAFDIRLHSPRRPNSRTSLPASFGGGASMGFNEMTPGEQRYFASISRIYSNNQMVRLKRRQYIDLLNQELTKGLYTKKEYERYRDYIALGRQRQYIKVQGRATSAPVRRIAYSDTDTNRSFTSNAEDDKSSVTDSNTKTTTTTNTDTTPKQKTKRTMSSDKRTPSATSTASRKSGGKISQQSRSRSASAKSTVSTKSSSSVKPKETKEETPQHREQKEEELAKDQTKCEDNSVKENDEERKKKKEGDTSDSDTNLPSEKQYSAREGHDRPKSRLGHIPEDGDQSDQTESKEEKYIDNEIKKEFKEDTTNDTQEQTSTQNGDAQKRSNDDENYEQKKTSDDDLREQKKSSDEQYHVQKRSDDDDDDNLQKRSIDGDNVQKQSRDDDDKVQKRRSRDSSDSESDEERQTRDPEKLPY